MKADDIKNLSESLSKLQGVTQDAVPEDLVEEIGELSKRVRLIFVELAILELIPKHFNFGEVISVTPLYGGLINQNFTVETNDGKMHHRLFVKRYRKAATNKEIILEHKFNQHLHKNEFPEVAKCLTTNEGKTFFEYRVKHLDSPDEKSRFAVYTHLEGDDRYDWLTPHCSEKDLASASAMLAKIHEFGYGFDSGEYAKEEPKILALMDEFPKYFSRYEKTARNSDQENIGYTYFLENLSSYLASMDQYQQLKYKGSDMLELMTHRDFHPGNQKYSDDGVVAAFDFDWCKEELRLFDVAITISYFCTSWKEHENGVLFLDEIEIFLRAYQTRLEHSEKIFGLTNDELEMLPEMIVLANMYVIWWDLQEIFEVEESESDDEACLTYLRHNTLMNEYALEHLEDIRAIAATFKS